MNPWLDVLARIRAETAQQAAGDDNATKPTKPLEQAQAGVAAGATDIAGVVTLSRAEVLKHDATEPTKPLFVGFVAPQSREKLPKSVTAAATLQNLQNPMREVEAPPQQRGCEPQTEGMSAAEQETLAQRAALLQHTAGLSQCHALLLAARLAERDAEGGWNGLRVCLECRHCHGRRGSWLCGAYRAAGSSTPALGQDFPLTFKRCPAFAPRWGG